MENSLQLSFSRRATKNQLKEDFYSLMLDLWLHDVVTRGSQSSIFFLK